MEEMVRFVEADPHDKAWSFLLGRRLDIQFITLFVYVGILLAKTVKAHLCGDLMLKIRGGLMVMVMEKTHKLGEADAQKLSDRRIVAEIELIPDTLAKAIDSTFAAVDAIIAISCLSRRIGKASLLVLGLISLVNIFGFQLGNVRRLKQDQREQIKCSRVSKTMEVLKQLPGIKLLGLGLTVREHIHRLRIKELETAKGFYSISAIFYSVQVFSDHVVPLLAITATHLQSGPQETMEPSQLSPILSIVQMLAMSIPKSLGVYTYVNPGLMQFGKVQAFLLLREQQDSRKKLQPPETFDKLPAAASSSSTPRNLKPVIWFKNASFRHLSETERLLSNVNFTLLQGSISAAVGPTGCGKSTLFQSILGEVKPTDGHVCTAHRSIAYCGTQPWLKTASIRENIVGPLPFDSLRYNAVIRGCQLLDDLKQLPAGDSYLVGPGGIRLSGGQRHKVSLARAAFAQCDVTILDDVFSSVDQRTALAILHALCGENGLLRNPDSTVLLATYLPQVLDIVDQVVLFRGQSVTLDTVEFRKPAQKQAIRNILASGTPCTSLAKENKDKAAIRRNLESRREKPSQVTIASSDEHQESRQLLPEYFSYMGKMSCLIMVFLSGLFAFLEFLPDICIRMRINDLSDTDSWHIFHVLSVFLTSITNFFMVWFCFCDLAFNGAINLHSEIIDLITRATYGHITSMDPTGLISWFEEDASMMAELLPAYFNRALFLGFELLFAATIMFLSSPYLLVTIPFLCLVVYYIHQSHMRASKRVARAESNHKEILDTYSLETSNGVLHMRANGKTSAVTVGQSLLVLQGFQRILADFVFTWTRFNMKATLLIRLKKLRATTPQEPNPPSPSELPDGWPLGDIELSNVSARGNTSLMLTLLGFLRYSGTVEIDGIDIETVTPDILRSRVITMTQDTVQFNDTVRANLLPFDINEEVKDDPISMVRKATKDGMLRNVHQQLNLWNKVSSNGGLDAMLQDVGFSKGELQLFWIARGVVQRLETGINFILMDEATSKLDPTLEDATHQFMEQIFQGCTVIIISHRQEVIDTTDCALRLEGGELINVEIPSNPLTWLGGPMPIYSADDLEEPPFDFSTGFTPESSVEPQS
ncbi:hypothetical protein NLG97_g2589 [Lecanicillium saksenae]|uniref:Uncharacterized protein n=1 Tax=Lecanicillium saksenae TaxID=468837 RepID=A0ACC1R4I2_9HYPO|nr:hypothetical protein NLG97_g2589 [Lecanicillium saksenae]